METLVRRAGFKLRRGKLDPRKFWLVDGEGRLFTPAAGTDIDTIRAILSPDPSSVPPRGNRDDG